MVASRKARRAASTLTLSLSLQSCEELLLLSGNLLSSASTATQTSARKTRQLSQVAVLNPVREGSPTIALTEPGPVPQAKAGLSGPRVPAPLGSARAQEGSQGWEAVCRVVLLDAHCRHRVTRLKREAGPGGGRPPPAAHLDTALGPGLCLQDDARGPCCPCGSRDALKATRVLSSSQP